MGTASAGVYAPDNNTATTIAATGTTTPRTNTLTGESDLCPVIRQALYVASNRCYGGTNTVYVYTVVSRIGEKGMPYRWNTVT